MLKTRKEKRKRKKQDGTYSWKDFLLDLLFAIPELLFYSFRLLWLLLRGLVRFIFEIIN